MLRYSRLIIIHYQVCEGVSHNMSKIQVQEYKPVTSLSDTQLFELGLNDTILQQLQMAGASIKYLSFSEADWAFPIVYFDPDINFEYRFTPFEMNWTSQKQIVKFANALRIHHQQEQKSNLSIH